MYQSYSVLSRIRKPRISRKEFLDYYQIREAEIQDCALQEFLDYFAISEDDLRMRSREEVLFTLLGFSLDREAEKAANRIGKGDDGENIGEVVFQYESGIDLIWGKVDFVGQHFVYGGMAHDFFPADRAVILQAVKDLRYVKRMVGEENILTGGICRLVVTDLNGGSYREEVPTARMKILLKILDTITTRSD